MLQTGQRWVYLAEGQPPVPIQLPARQSLLAVGEQEIAALARDEDDLEPVHVYAHSARASEPATSGEVAAAAPSAASNPASVPGPAALGIACTGSAPAGALRQLCRRCLMGSLGSSGSAPSRMPDDRLGVSDGGARLRGTHTPLGADVPYRRVGQVALITPGETRATADPVIAKKLAQDLLDTLQTERVGERTRATEAHRRETEAACHAALHGLDRGAELATYAARHLSVLEKEDSNPEQWLDATALMLDRAIYFFDVLQVESATPEERDKHQGLRGRRPRRVARIAAPREEASRVRSGTRTSGTT